MQKYSPPGDKKIVVSMNFKYAAIGGVVEVANNAISGLLRIAPGRVAITEFNEKYRQTKAGSIIRFAGELLLSFKYWGDDITLLFPNYFCVPLPFAKSKSVVVVHDIMFKHYPEYVGRAKRLVLDISYRIVQRYADGVIFISKDSEADFIKTYGKPKKYTTIYNPIVLSGSDPSVVRSVAPLTEPYAIANFYFYPHKNLQGLLKLFDEIHREWPELNLIFTGKKTDDFDSLLMQCEARHRVQHLGFLPKEQLMAVVRDAKLFMSMSKFEGFNMSAAEAALLGKPLILSDLPVHRELFADCAQFVPLNGGAIDAKALVHFVKTHVARQPCFAEAVTPAAAAVSYLAFIDQVAAS